MIVEDCLRLPLPQFRVLLLNLDTGEPGVGWILVIGGRVLRPEETVEMISTTEPDLARRFQAAIARPEKHITYCYCSIFQECWLADSRKDLQSPDAVEMCPDFGDEGFKN